MAEHMKWHSWVTLAGKSDQYFFLLTENDSYCMLRPQKGITCSLDIVVMAFHDDGAAVGFML